MNKNSMVFDASIDAPKIVHEIMHRGPLSWYCSLGIVCCLHIVCLDTVCLGIVCLCMVCLRTICLCVACLGSVCHFQVLFA